MTFYAVDSKESVFSAIEAYPDSGIRFFYLNSLESKAKSIEWLVSAKMGQTIISEAMVDGKPVVITRDNGSATDFLATLKSQGMVLNPQHYRKAIDPWVIRGHVSNAGQVLQLYSSLAKKQLKPDLLAFSALSLTANYVNITFGSEKEKDPHRLFHVKQELHKLFSQNGTNSFPLPGLEDRSYADERLDLNPPPALSPTKMINNFVERNSVRFGEIGLRLVGVTGMVFPFDRFGKMASTLKTEGMGQALKVGLNPNRVRLYGGLTYFIGKSTSLFAKTPDPYNPAPKSGLDEIREKYLFKACSVVEASAASIVAAGAFTGDFGKSKVDSSDYIGGAGAAILAAGLLGRVKAPFGEKTLDIEEVFAYAEGAIAKSSGSNMPWLISETAALLKNKIGEPATFGDIYTRLMVDLYHRYNIAIDIKLSNIKAFQLTASSEVGATEAESKKWCDKIQTPAAISSRLTV
jgi:hypothetical protein